MARNFLRFLENWNGDTLNYKGSLVSALLLHLQHWNLRMLQLRGL